jgi:hypothetical protein
MHFALGVGILRTFVLVALRPLTGKQNEGHVGSPSSESRVRIRIVGESKMRRSLACSPHPHA